MVVLENNGQLLSLSWTSPPWNAHRSVHNRLRLIVLVNILLFISFVEATEIPLEDFHLKKSKKYSKIPIQILMGDSNDEGMIEDIDGNKYDLARLEPYADLFSPRYYVQSNDKTTVTDTRTGESFAVPIYRANYDDGSVLLVEKDTEQGNRIIYMELRRQLGEPDFFLVSRASEEKQGTDGYDSNNNENSASDYLAFTEDDVDYELLQSQFQYAEVSSLNTRRLRSSKDSSASSDAFAPTIEYRKGRSSFEAVSLRGSCSSYVVVNIAIVFDSLFCEIYGGFVESRRRIMMIVASASFHYERDMCVKLELTNIYTPESSCFAHRSRSSFFEDYNRDVPCGTDASFLTRFSSLMKRNRSNIRIDTDATVHMFSGYPPPAGTIGCAYVGSLCNNEFAYGLEYVTFSANPHSQGVVLAHEVGHVLDAPHLQTSSFYRHVMEPNINNAADGFAQQSINRILSFLRSSDITCDSSTSATPRPTSRPVPAPSPRTPAPIPDDVGCKIYQGFHDPTCIFTSSNDGRYACYDISTLLRARASSTCLFPNPKIRILRCNGRLRTGEVPDEGVDLDPPRVFETRSCSASCVVVSDFVCFLADKNEREYSISYAAVADFDVADTFTTEVFVKRDNGSNDCDVAATRCI